ncbi:uncharacterized protein LOC111874973 [Cryptotermes secundus]|uniref:uncharacterized protein LOC111874973 n=1 Tax=Cryptotermes secundus TaxID=105785 RepID=UPI000CD7BAD9|nr:uncharacterized protein LOC111874973 [Cryptotermes secundus]
MSLVWTDQSSNKSKWPTFTTPAGKTITLPPRRYILFGNILSPLTQELLQEYSAHLREHHTLSKAPEPLARLNSHLQILQVHIDHPPQSEMNLIISLTNTSSRTVRQAIFLAAIRILGITPYTMLIQEGSTKEPLLSYSTNDASQVITVLLETKLNKEELLTSTQPTMDIFTTPMTELLRHHRPALLQTQLETMIRVEALPSTSNQPTTTSPDLYYTFILHKTTFDALPPTSKKSPTFATFDHGDHIHIVFSVRHSNNVSRHVNSILSFLKTGLSGNAEAHTSLQLIRYTTRFISYLIRKGISTFNKYGNKSLSIIKPILDALAKYDITDSSADNMPCQQYVEEKKDHSQGQPHTTDQLTPANRCL